MRASVSGLSLEYEVAGDGPDLVWLHGLTGSVAESRHLCERLAQDYRVLWYSTRGHGRSSAVVTRQAYTYDLIADDLAQMIAHVGFRHPVLAGGSHGANTILRHEHRHPGLARGLVLVAPGANALARPKRTHWWLIRGQLRWLELRHGPDGLIRALTGQDPTDPAHDTVAVDAMRTHDLSSLRAAMRYIADQQVVDPGWLSTFRVPTVVASWSGDPLIHPIAVGRAIAELIPGAEFREIDKPGQSSLVAAADYAAPVISGLIARVLSG